MLKINEKILKNLFNSCHIQTLFWLLVFCTIFFISFAYGNKINKEDIIIALEKKYSFRSFSTDFTQISKLAALDITEQASGKAFFSHPGKMKWQYMTPEHHEIITNGKFLWIYRPEENQVMTGDASQFFKSGTGGAFLSDISIIRKNYIINLKKAGKDYVEIDLTPKKKNPDISFIVVRISQKNNEITRVVTYNSYNDTTLFELSNIQFEKINPEIFEFHIPSGVDKIDMN